MKIIWDDRAWEEYLYWQSQDKKTLKKINELMDLSQLSFSLSVPHGKSFM